MILETKDGEWLMSNIVTSTGSRNTKRKERLKMKRNFKAGKRNGRGLEFRVFTDDELHDIHTATLEVLWKTGVYVEDQEAIDVFAGGGAIVDSKTKMVKLTPSMVEDAVRSAPEIVLLAGRDPKNDLLLEPGRVGFDCFGEAIEVLDPVSRQSRAPLQSDLADATRLVDALDHIDICHRSMGCHDVHPKMAVLYNAVTLLNNTTKHIFLGPDSGFMLKKIIEMLSEVVGGRDKLQDRPIMTCGTCPVTPLRLPRDCCEIVLESARSGMVTKCLSQCMAGGSSPVTLAGTLVLHNSEILSTCVLSQLAKKGAPFIYASSSCTLDLRFGTCAVGTPETALINAAVTQLGKYYLLPVQVAGG